MLVNLVLLEMFLLLILTSVGPTRKDCASEFGGDPIHGLSIHGAGGQCVLLSWVPRDMGTKRNPVRLTVTDHSHDSTPSLEYQCWSSNAGF